MLYREKNATNDSVIKMLFFIILSLSVATYISTINYLLFHTIVELFSVVVACSISLMAFNNYNISKNHYITFLGIAYGFIAGFDLLHTLAFEGMGVFKVGGNNLATQLWTIARYMESISLLIALLYLKKKLNTKPVIITYLITSLTFLMVVFYWSIFPDCYVEDIGLTMFKIVSEYIISIIIVITIVLLMYNRRYFKSQIFWLICFSLIATILSELAFTLYVDVYGIFNMTGHLLKLLSFYFIYKGIVEVNFKLPYEEAHKSQESYKNLVDIIPTGICIINEGTLCFANSGFLKLLGVNALDQILDKPILNYIDSSSHNLLTECINQIKEEKINESKEIELRRHDGKILFIEFKGTKYVDFAENAILIIMQDISAQKKAEKLENNLIKQKNLLRQSEEYDRLKTEFFNNLSHELRTPLNLIFSTIQLLEINLQAFKDVKVKKYMGSLRQNCYRMLRLINNLLDITKLDEGYFKLNLRNHNIVAIVEDITLSIAQQAEKNGINLVFDTNVEEKTLAIDPNAIERIILNLLSNALKFTNRGDEVIVTLLDKGETITISVKDSGIGIPQDKLNDIFDRFKQVEKPHKGNHQGTGIGLALVESLVKMHEGVIIARSNYGEGAEFIISLPVKEMREDNQLSLSNQSEDNLKRHVESIRIEFSDIYSLEHLGQN
ncbi:sensor histidine kinase [Alkaliphilus peptidifermentans]|uniref:histidine kinase n=1 Tax=Alkaliphilus peptidifermentans DSM 18978 TaxID=1120976 RepID=A0A1G5IZR8_9FIRM|nr:MASE3 domain-containing protein [Alkaliphilus peptidifermentans]SCY81552.1 PAS domain S-box-containing protein [Alkaliphilus peptidifermentans DSM 18978]